MVKVPPPTLSKDTLIFINNKTTGATINYLNIEDGSVQTDNITFKWINSLSNENSAVVVDPVRGLILYNSIYNVGILDIKAKSKTNLIERLMYNSSLSININSSYAFFSSMDLRNFDTDIKVLSLNDLTKFSKSITHTFISRCSYIAGKSSALYCTNLTSTDSYTYIEASTGSVATPQVGTGLEIKYIGNVFSGNYYGITDTKVNLYRNNSTFYNFSNLVDYFDHNLNMVYYGIPPVTDSTNHLWLVSTRNTSNPDFNIVEIDSSKNINIYKPSITLKNYNSAIRAFLSFSKNYIIIIYNIAVVVFNIQTHEFRVVYEKQDNEVFVSTPEYPFYSEAFDYFE